MPPSIPTRLLELLELLAIEVRPYHRKIQNIVQRLTRDLPQFESVWIDAFVQVNLITPYQAAQFHQQRAEQLRVEQYVIYDSITDLGYAKTFKARHVETKQIVSLTVANPSPINSQLESWPDEFLQLLNSTQSLNRKPLIAFGKCGERFWIVSDFHQGESAAAWMVRNGRLPAVAVLEIARKLADEFSQREQLGLIHGDLRAATLLLSRTGNVHLTADAIRPILRPTEGFALNDLSPEMYDGLSPQRVQDGAAASIVSEIYSFGSLCWRLLTGRPTVPGGNSITKLQNIAKGKIPDVRQLAFDVPQPLAEVVNRCLAYEPSQRPESFAKVSQLLSEPTPKSQKVIAALCSENIKPVLPVRTKQKIKDSKNSNPLLLWVTMILVAVAAITSPWWKSSWPTPTVSIPQPVVPLVNSKAKATNVSKTQKTNDPQVPVVRREELLLTTRNVQTLFTAKLKSGCIVRPATEGRLQVSLPEDGLQIQADGLRFENIDFVMQTRSTTMIHLAAANVEFHRCSFQFFGQKKTKQQPADEETSPETLPVAIRWSGTANLQESEDLLLNGQVNLNDCCFYQVAAAIECRTAGAKTVRLTNVLHLGPGPMLLVNGLPQIDEPMSINLSHVTLRDANSLIQFQYRTIPQAVGKIKFQANGCALIPSTGKSKGSGTLFQFIGPQSPKTALRQIHWQGQGSLLKSETAVAQWKNASGKHITLDDSRMSIAGLVHSKVKFAGNDKQQVSHSKLTKWQVPLRSTEAPGIEPQRLSLPLVEAKTNGS